MPQMQLPIFPAGVTHITAGLAFDCRDGLVVYFHGILPVFSHADDDIQSFKMITAQFCVNGHTKQSTISRIFGITKISVKRSVQRYRSEGAGGFFKPRTKRGPSVLTRDVIVAAQRLLDEGDDTCTVADKLGIKISTLRKAITQGRLCKPEAPLPLVIVKGANMPSSKSERSTHDAEASLGVGATNEMGRVLARFGLLNGVEPKFENAMDVSCGGVLFALPALMVCGLLRAVDKYFSLPKGYYSLETIFLLLAFMALSRLKTMESLRYCAPGEWGKLLGLDRIPEVKTLREKIGHLSTQGEPQEWSKALCREWMEGQPDSSQALYIDGHVRVYNGSQTKLPRHYVARQRLCLRAITDYWVNAMDGQPFFVVSKEVDPGLIKVLEQDIVPRLEKDVPSQPSKQSLAENDLLHRFCLIFDREGYSPDFIKRMKKKHIACLTYHKHPSNDWPASEFNPHEVTLASGEKVKMSLAERGVYLGKQVWVREIRKLTESGHQTSMISTNYLADPAVLASTMFARWSQENFFAYMREHYGLDRVIDYQTENIPDTTRVINPKWRSLDSEVRGKNGIAHRLLAKFGAIEFKEPIGKAQIKKYQQTKAELKESIIASQREIEKLKIQRKEVNKHIDAAELPVSDKFKRLQKDSKHFIDTIKMIAYRAETAMAYTIKENMSKPNDARALLRCLYQTEADIVPDMKNNTIEIRVHHMANHCENEIVNALCKELNETKTIFPGSNLQIIYKMGSSENLPGQDV